MAMSTTATVTSLDGFHATPAAQRADKLVRALFDANQRRRSCKHRPGWLDRSCLTTFMHP